jgi:uncharacterized protein YcbK (DUF882 family)
MTDRHAHSRRRFLRQGLGWAAAGATPKLALAAVPAAGTSGALRELAFNHTHTGERINLVYAVGSDYVTDALGRLNLFLRDHYSGTVGHIDPLLFDQLHQVRTALGARMPYEVISGFRCPETNENLRQTRAGGVAKRSMHMEGRAIDVRLPGVPLAELRDAALSLQAGGVGYYPAEQFVHMDTGRVRRWG